MSRYNLTIARPQGFLHSSAFVEVRDSLAWALAELGHEVNSSENHFSHRATNILFGTETLSGHEDIPPGTIIYNLEQPTHPRMELVKEMARGHQVWDFSQHNVEAWKRDGYDARYLPIAYTPYLTRIPPVEKQDIDILFCGWLTPRRLKMKERLEELDPTWKVVFTDASYGGGRDNLIARSKVCVNVHHDGRDMTEIVRLSYLLANRKAIITETASDDSDYEYLELSRWGYELLPNAVRMALINDYLRHRLEQQGFRRFSKNRLISYLKQLVN